MASANYCCVKGSAMGISICEDCRDSLDFHRKHSLGISHEERLRRFDEYAAKQASARALIEGRVVPAITGTVDALKAVGESMRRSDDEMRRLGYNLDELERDNPYNQWMKDIEV